MGFCWVIYRWICVMVSYMPILYYIGVVLTFVVIIIIIIKSSLSLLSNRRFSSTSIIAIF